MVLQTHDPDDASARRSRRQLGAWYTPDSLVDLILDGAGIGPFLEERARRIGMVRVLDPACGDGRFLAAVRDTARAHGVECELVGADLDGTAVAASRRALPGVQVLHTNALTHNWERHHFDLVIGNPPFLSQMSSSTTRGGSSGRGGGPYADAAVEFMMLAAELVEPDGGRVVFVLPQSVLAARDAKVMRSTFDHRSTMLWSWWTGEKVFDAQVLTCALAFEFGRSVRTGEMGNWSHVVTSRQIVPALPSLLTSGTLADRAVLNANFRDEYYGMVPAVGDHEAGPLLITSGLIDPGRTMWGHRPITFARSRFDAPRLDLGLLDSKMQRWAARRLVPKVLVANQTRIIEAVCDADGTWLPAVPVIGVYPGGWIDEAQPGLFRTRPRTGQVALVERAWAIAAVLTSPVASAWAWHRSAGSGLSATSIRLGPVMLGALPWPAGDLTSAVESLQIDDVRGCGRAVIGAYGIENDGVGDVLCDWWEQSLRRIERRSADHD